MGNREVQEWRRVHVLLGVLNGLHPLLGAGEHSRQARTCPLCFRLMGLQREGSVCLVKPVGCGAVKPNCCQSFV